MSTKPKTKLVIFSANWCLPCKMIHKWMVEDEIVKNLISKYDVDDVTNIIQLKVCF